MQWQTQVKKKKRSNFTIHSRSKGSNLPLLQIHTSNGAFMEINFQTRSTFESEQDGLYNKDIFMLGGTE